MVSGGTGKEAQVLIQRLLLLLLCMAVARYQVDSGVTGTERPGCAFSGLRVHPFDCCLPPGVGAVSLPSPERWI